MSKFSEQRLTSEVVFDGKIIRVERDEVLLPNGEHSVREVVRYPGAVAIVVKHGEQLILVRQYRYALGQETLEIPAGKKEPGEDRDLCALRELREETGYRGKLTFLGKYYSTPGFTNELMYLYLATDLTWDPLIPDADEFLMVEKIPISTAVERALNAQFDDAKTILGILMAHGRGYFNDIC